MFETKKRYTDKTMNDELMVYLLNIENPVLEIPIIRPVANTKPKTQIIN
jgi:hypothetical protein